MPRESLICFRLLINELVPIQDRSRADQIAAQDDVNEVIIAGGAQIYKLALPYTTRYELTEVHDDIDGDAFLDPLPAEKWQETSRATIKNPDGPDYSFVTLNRLLVAS